MQEVISDTSLIIHFIDEVTQVTSFWRFHVTTPVSACQIIEAVRQPWYQMFAVELDVVCSHSAQIVKSHIRV